MNMTYHVAWVPRRRKPILVDAIGERLDQLIKEKAEDLGIELVNYQRSDDFVYLNIEADTRRSLDQIVHALKSHTASHLRREFFDVRRMPSMWTRKYLATNNKRMTYPEIRSFVDAQSKRD